ncbi:hypothetical protein Roomu2_00108 [Pseudomonas phage vB_PpuM-Roomu-2]|uniref:Uncharacterized protein n=1 Tax=Pseudomonas phage vB_PpuM-Roomu-2 TaxID=3132621 RepID=A0AAX4N0A9_9CAUD
MNYKVEATAQLAQGIKAAGFRVFIAKSGTYGFYTDSEGSRVVCFQHDLGGFKFSGNYKAKNAQDARDVGSGWVMGDIFNLQPEVLKTMFASSAPHWATKGLAVTLVTLKQHLDTYQASSNYTEI